MMNRNAGFVLAVAFAVTAAVRLPASHGPAAAGEIRSAGSLASHSQAHTVAPPSAYRGGCTAYDSADDQAAPDPDRGAARSALDRFFAAGRPGPGQATPQGLLSQTGVHYAIALAADPRHTNLSLVFDRQMAVIQQAAQDQSYTYDSSWLPWTSGESTYPLLTDQESADDLSSHRDACPGVLLFRRSVAEGGPGSTSPYQGALVVLVVGEQPTGGINQDQWDNAVHWLGEHASATGPDGQPRMLRVLGPSFSGSLVSLGRALVALYPGQAVAAPPTGFAAKFPSVRVLSGSVSDCASIGWFEELLDRSLPSVVFGSFEENDDRQIYSFLRYLKSQGTEANDTAILSEDETAYSGKGAQADVSDRSSQPCSFPYAPDHHPIRLFFPRDISALRNAYEKESIFTTTSISGSGERTTHPILREGGESTDPGANPSDTILAYGGALTPVAQEAVLFGTVSYMRAHHTRFVLLRCTNPLDFLFLTRFFHRHYPEGRIVTVGSDLLFRREIDTTEFRGVLSLSNYPLLPRNQHWSTLTERQWPTPGHSHRAFENAGIEGTYLAARYLFSRGNELSKDQHCTTWTVLPLIESLPEYADPFWLHQLGETIEQSHAPTWLTVVGRDGYWPIAVLNGEWQPKSPDRLDGTSGHGLPPPSTMVRLASTSAHYDRDGDGKHLNQMLRAKLPLPWTICASLGICLLLYQICGILQGDGNAAQGLFSIFRRVSAPAQEILLGIHCALAAMLLVLPMSIGFTLPRDDLFASADGEYWSFLLFGVALVLAAALGLLRNRRWRGSRRWLALVCFLVTLFAMAGLSLYTLEKTLVGGGNAAEQANRVPLFYRLGHVTAGVSPLLPVLFLFAGFYLWTWQAMAGNTLLCAGRPILPKLERIQKKDGLRKWYWLLLGNPVDETGRGFNRLNRSQIRMSQELGKQIVHLASPVSVPYAVLILPAGLLIGALVYFWDDLPLLTLEGHTFALSLNLGLLLAFLLIAAEASRLFWTWTQLHRLLSKLNRLRLRRTFARLRAIEASSLWSVSGDVQRVQYLFFSQQLDAAIRLDAIVTNENPLLSTDCLYLRDAIRCGKRFDRLSARRLNKGPRWDQTIYRPSDGKPSNVRDVMADAVAEVLNRILWPCWLQEESSLTLATAAATDEASRTTLELPLSESATIRTAEEFVCFQYIAFIQNILARMRTMTLSMILLFIAVSLAIGFYPFVPRTQISMWMIVNLALIGAPVVYVYAGMDRDDILSYLTNTRPGKLSAEFWLKSAAFLAGPAIGILTTQFPAVADSILGWVQPGLDAMK